MTDAELFAVFGREFDADGRPVFDDAAPPAPDERKLFELHCRLNCVTDPAEVARLWAAELARRPKPRTPRRDRPGTHPRP